MVILILIVLGVCLGSFVNAFVWRHYKVEELKAQREELQANKANAKELERLNTELSTLSISRGRSMCTHCGHALAAKDLIPVLSFLALRGKCRYCGKPIQDTPVAELLTPVLFVVSYIFWPNALQGAEWFIFTAWLIFIVGFVALILYDLRHFLLPHSIVLPLIGLAIVSVLIDAFVVGGGITVIASAFWGALVIGGLFYVLFRVSNEKWIGGGDITLGVLLGLLVGGPANALLLIFIASLLGTLVAIPLLLMKKATRTTHLPFGPFLILSAVIVMLFGERILNWYATLLIV